MKVLCFYLDLSKNTWFSIGVLKTMFLAVLILYFSGCGNGENATNKINCYELGFKYGSCTARSMKGLACKPETDIVIPENCRNSEEALAGIKDGTKSEW